MTDSSPRILRLHWGSIETEAGRFRDAKLWPGGGRGWDWGETGTRHEPGVQAADVAELLANGARLVVLGRGQQGRLQVTEEAKDAIESAGAVLETHQSGEAVDRYNRAAERGEPVAALIHSTC